MKHLYDRVATGYDEWYTKPKGRLVDRIEKEALYAYLQPQKGQKLLDIGCGTGQYALSLAALGLEVSGVDISTAMLSRAQAKAEKAGLTVDFRESNALDLPFSAQTFNLVLSVTALEFVPDLPAALQEAFRVLKSGGRLVIGLIAKNSAWERYYVEKARRDPANIFNRARFYTLNELLAAMPGSQVEGRAVLFVPPDFDFRRGKKALALEAAARRAGRTDGGFICAVSVK